MQFFDIEAEQEKEMANEEVTKKKVVVQNYILEQLEDWADLIK